MAPKRLPPSTAAESSTSTAAAATTAGERQQSQELQQQAALPRKALTLVKLNVEEVEEAKQATSLWLKVVERTLLPHIDYREYKGRYGKVCIIGGSAEFTGAPFFVASAALSMGADLATIITTPSAATAIKSYSPEIIVYPILPCHSSPRVKEHEPGGPSEQQLELAKLRLLAEPLLRKADVIVIGPGLGGSTNYRPHPEDEIEHQRQLQLQQQQQSHPHVQKQLVKLSSRERFSHFFKDAVEDIHRAVRGAPSAQEKAAAAAAVAAADPTNPVTLDPAAVRIAIKEAEAAAGSTQRAAIMLLRFAMLLQKPIVLDADMLRILCIPTYEHLLLLFAHYPQAVLTPNAYEMEMLLRSLKKVHNKEHSPPAEAPLASLVNAQLHALLPESVCCELFVQKVAEATAFLSGPCLFAKGRLDMLGVPLMAEGVENEAGVCLATVGLDRRFAGSPKRSGGQGDVLCGVIAQTMVWMERAKNTNGFQAFAAEVDRLSLPLPLKHTPTAVSLTLMHAASIVTREAAALAYRQYGRSMSARHILEKINAAAAVVFPSGWLTHSSC